MNKTKQDDQQLGFDVDDGRRDDRRGRTLLAQLGFSDQDRKEPRHDAACRYIVESATRVLDVLMPDMGKLGWTVTTLRTDQEVVLASGRGFVTGFVDVAMAYRLRFVSKKCDDCTLVHSDELLVEVKIGKVTIGEAIRQLKLYESKWDWKYPRRETSHPEIEHRLCAHWLEFERPQREAWAQARAEESTQLERQQVYTEYLKSAIDSLNHQGGLRGYRPHPAIREVVPTLILAPRKLLVTAYQITERERQTLAAEGIAHAVLGDRFEKWYAESSVSHGQEI